ncbi:hypothetical protein V6N11_034304 [Hibiscus sabdariffa]|uniref:Uncharacterized protein n=1 Tax=Hibiscus sabdariffa TaxID=183260 RepID=A0ABR1ZZA9_9ROSI
MYLGMCATCIKKQKHIQKPLPTTVEKDPANRKRGISADDNERSTDSTNSIPSSYGVTEGEDHRLDGSKRGPFLSTYPVEDKMDSVNTDSFGELILCASRFPDLSSVPAVRLGLRD